MRQDNVVIHTGTPAGQRLVDTPIVNLIEIHKKRSVPQGAPLTVCQRTPCPGK